MHCESVDYDQSHVIVCWSLYDCCVLSLQVKFSRFCHCFAAASYLQFQLVAVIYTHSFNSFLPPQEFHVGENAAATTNVKEVLKDWVPRDLAHEVWYAVKGKRKRGGADSDVDRITEGAEGMQIDDRSLVEGSIVQADDSVPVEPGMASGVVPAPREGSGGSSGTPTPRLATGEPKVPASRHGTQPQTGQDDSLSGPAIV